MSKKRIISLLLVFVLLLISFTVRPMEQNTMVYAGSTLNNKQALTILERINPHIINYDVKTHKVTYDNGDYVFVTPPGGIVRNGDTTWKYFIEQKGDLRGWLKYNTDEIIRKKTEILKEHGIIVRSSPINAKNYDSLPNSGEVYITQFPQEYCPWCGPASTKSAITGWLYSRGIGILPPQDSIAKTEFGYDNNPVPYDNDPIKCSHDPGVSCNAIAYALNGYIFSQWSNNYWYKEVHFSDTDTRQFKIIVQVDVGECSAPVIFCGYARYLTAWGEPQTKAVHYTAVYGYNFSSGTISYTDSVNGVKWHKRVPPKCTESLNNYFNYAKEFTAVG